MGLRPDYVYMWTPVTPHQKNVSIASSTALTIPTGATYAVITAVGGPAYYTFDAVAPTTSSYAGTVAQGSQIAFEGIHTLNAILIIGTSMSVAYFN